MEDSKSLLKKLTNHYKQHKVSVLVGAGFSRNAYNKFPLWGDLLHDAMIELYGKKIKDAYNVYLKTFQPPFYISYTQFEKDQLARIVEDKDYLQIVSEYIKKKGNRESMDVYIEKRIPFVIENKGAYKLNIAPSFPFDSKNLDVHAALLNCNWLDVYTTNYDNLLEMAARDRNLSYNEITADYSLGDVSKSRSIVKLHGDLVDNSLSEKYEFDNDKTLRYIISKEDYETYPHKHEAFTQMMRIAMLKGVFLLVGFSGTDPNFLAWLNWMKDILDKNPSGNKDYIKVFLLLLHKEDITTEQELYYRNHRIGVIYLDDADFIKEITGENSPTLSHADSFIHFFDYLKNKERGCLRQADVRDITSSWSELESKFQKKEDIKDLLQTIQSKSERLRKNTFWQERILDSLYRKPDEWTDDERVVANLAVKDVGVLSLLLFNEKHKEDAEKLEVWSDINHKFQILNNTYTPIADPQDDAEHYYNLLYYAYKLDIVKVREILANWKPQGRFIQCWASFNSTFDLKASDKVLDDYIAAETNMQEKYLASWLRNGIDFQIPQVYTYYEYANTVGFDGIRKRLLQSVRKQNDNIRPHGWNGTEYKFGSDIERARAAVGVLNLLVETGFLTSYRIVSMIDNKDWYHVFQYAYEIFPYPCLFYSLMYGDDKILTRIGQDIAYSDNLIEETSDMLLKLLNCIKENKFYGNWDAYWIIASELAVAVKPIIWIEPFLTILDDVLLANIKSLTYSTSPYKCVKKMLTFFSDKELQERIFNVFIKHIQEDPIAVGDLLLNLDKQFELKETTIEALRTAMEELPVTKSHYIVASLLDNESAKTVLLPIIANKLKTEDMEFSTADRWSTIHTLTYLTNNDPEAQGVLKGMILSRDIWCCGVNDAHSGSNPHYLDLSKISSEIDWNEEELKIIVTNIEKNINLLELIDFNDHFFRNGYIELVAGIKNFIENRVKQEFVVAIEEINGRVDSLLRRLIQENDFYQAMSTDDITKVNVTVTSLIKSIELDGFEKYRSQVVMCLTRAFFPEKSLLGYMLSLVAYLSEKHIDEISKVEYKSMVYSVLEKYATEDLVQYDLNIPFVYHQLIRIAKCFEGQSGECKAIKYWLEDDKVNRFNFHS